ncbi:MAG TPA: thioredoxin domain-containing protein, partial [Anaerolineae bacterium]|nr:thioredoxin domain-containing protein [Anaerolineae bacterium]
MPNRLANETSPYLLQHADNPVDWYPWCDEAFAVARAQDKPVFLSIGYSACHWCHVMAHESFADRDTAALLNEHFVSIKVDREERPDLDRIYMAAVQAMTGSGGWPMSVFLTPDGKPFYGGTYFPPQPRHGMPAFAQVLAAIAQAWRARRAELLAGSERVVQAMAQASALPAGAERPDLDPGTLDAAVAQLRARFDAARGGWGTAPKFPQPMAIEYLLQHHHRTGDAGVLQMATATLDAMARGGIYDQIGGGFHRYSVDERWLVPHFEKMLYDNAQLARVYLHAWQLTGNDSYRTIAQETLDYVAREMRSPEGGFYSTQDADSEGEEGKFFAWTVDQIRDVLGDAAGAFIAAYGVKQGGNTSAQLSAGWEGKNILELT